MVAKKKDALKSYRTRRTTAKSGEPAGTKATSTRKLGKKALFVIQKHAASHLHYDVRLEIGGVLVSWAVPKGPSTDPKDKRLAVRTDDHPLAYATFEGVIPQGNYGAGLVMVWDTGTYENMKTNDAGKPVPMAECLKKDQIEVFLYGKVLTGGYALVAMKSQEKDNWLLIKMNDDYAHKPKNPTKTVTKSALTQRTTKQIKKDAMVKDDE